MDPSLLPRDLVAALRRAGAITALTGAGMSAESGIPTFRDAQTGIWARFDPQALASRAGFMRDPRRVWEWYASRRAAMARAAPNAGHRALAEMERHGPMVTVITQNIDGLHARAGSQRVIELHGNVERVRCFAEDVVVAAWDDAGDLPRCPRCGGLLRPDVVWFGELLPIAALAAAIEAARYGDVFLSIGTSGLVEPAASLAHEALACRVPVVEINPEPTPLTPLATFALRGRAGEVLPELVAAAWGERPL